MISVLCSKTENEYWSMRIMEEEDGGTLTLDLTNQHLHSLEEVECAPELKVGLCVICSVPELCCGSSFVFNYYYYSFSP